MPDMLHMKYNNCGDMLKFLLTVFTFLTAFINIFPFYVSVPPDLREG